MMPAINTRVVTPDGRAGVVIGTRSRFVKGQENPLGYQVRLDGVAQDGPHPWFLAEQLQVEEAARCGS